MGLLQAISIKQKQLIHEFREFNFNVEMYPNMEAILTMHCLYTEQRYIMKSVMMKKKKKFFLCWNLSDN